MVPPHDRNGCKHFWSHKLPLVNLIDPQSLKYLLSHVLQKNFAKPSKPCLAHSKGTCHSMFNQHEKHLLLFHFIL